MNRTKAIPKTLQKEVGIKLKTLLKNLYPQSEVKFPNDSAPNTNKPKDMEWQLLLRNRNNSTISRDLKIVIFKTSKI